MNWQPKAIFSIASGIDIYFSLDDCTMNKSRVFFAKVLIDIDMIFVLPNQILVKILGLLNLRSCLHFAFHAK